MTFHRPTFTIERRAIPMGATPKVEMDIERLLHWAYRDELSKRQTSAAEGIWDRIVEDGQRGGIDPGHGAAQRYSHFGLPDPDAEAVERAVAALEDVVIDWAESFDSVAADLAGLVTVNDVARRRNAAQRTPQASWGASGEKALKAWWGRDGVGPVRDKPRDVLLVGGLSTKVLVTSHAIRGDRPDWREDPPQPRMVQALKGPNAMVHGECRGRNLYTTGSYCPLKWEPSPITILQSRADYLAWHRGLSVLAERLQLAKFIALPPKAPQLPWFGDDEAANIVPVMPTGRNSVDDWGVLPLKPARGRMGSSARIAKGGPVRYPLRDAECG